MTRSYKSWMKGQWDSWHRWMRDSDSHENDAATVSGKRKREWRRWGVYMTRTAVCATQMGVNFRQSSSSVPLWTVLLALSFQVALERWWIKASLPVLRRRMGSIEKWSQICMIIVAPPLLLKNRAWRIGVPPLGWLEADAPWRSFWAVYLSSKLHLMSYAKWTYIV